MENGFLSKIGMGGLDIGLVVFILVILLFITVIVLAITITELCKLKKRYLRFSAGRDARSLEKEIGRLFVENQSIRDITDMNRRDIKRLFKKMEMTIQKVGLVRYNAFNQMGGNLSFCLCLLNEKDDGFIINSVHSTDGCYTYTKDIKAGRCDLTLGTEETNALNMAMHE